MRSNRAGGAGIGDALHGWELRLMACFMVNNEFSTAVCMAPGGETDCSPLHQRHQIFGRSHGRCRNKQRRILVVDPAEILVQRTERAAKRPEIPLVTAVGSLPAVLFPFLLLVFHRSYLFVAALPAGLVGTAKFVNARLAGSLGTDGKPRQQLFEILAVTRWACRGGRCPKHKELEFVRAPGAPILVNWHLLAAF